MQPHYTQLSDLPLSFLIGFSVNFILFLVVAVFNLKAIKAGNELKQRINERDPDSVVSSSDRLIRSPERGMFSFISIGSEKILKMLNSTEYDHIPEIKALRLRCRRYRKSILICILIGAVNIALVAIPAIIRGKM